jgi:hypothetical protein
MLQHNIFSGFQYCESAKKASKVAAVFFDIKKAFDSVPHEKLLLTMADKYLLPPYWIQFLNSYLSGRTMRVKVGDKLSNSSNVDSGVPQGSVVGPTLFLAFINAVSEVRLDSKTKLILYADDIALTHPFDEEKSATKIQGDIDSLSHCIESLGLEFNATKSQYMIIHLGNALPNPFQIPLRINQSHLKCVSCVKYLGVEVDDRLTFGAQSAKVAAMTKKGIGALSRVLRKWLTPNDVLKKSITTIAMPTLLYAIDVWYPPSVQHQVQIERIQKFAARLLSNNFNHSTSYIELLQTLNWKPIYRIVAERRLINVKKYLLGIHFISSDVFPLQEESTSRCSARLKAKTNNHKMLMKTWNGKGGEREEKLAAAQSRKLWNALPEEVVTDTLEGFERSVKSDSVFDLMCERGVLTPLSCV